MRHVMASAETPLLDVLLDSWQRNNQIMLNLLGALPDGGLTARAHPDSPTVGQQLMHMAHERLISVAEEAPEFARAVPESEWASEASHEEIAQLLVDSAATVQRAIRGRVVAGQPLDRQFDHPILLLQMLLWHEGYHHGQIKLALKLSGQPIPDDNAGPLTWDVWRNRRQPET